jgi:cytochrome c553
MSCRAAEFPEWAYPIATPDYKPAPDDGVIRRVPGSAAGYTVSDSRNLFAAPIWHPTDHPKLPDIVAQGRKPVVQACGVCHRADGRGGPENANIAGLPAAYIIQQFADYKSVKRGTARPKRLPQALMMSLSKQITDEEIQEAAKYFSALKPRANIRVVETASIPQVYVAGWFWADRKNGGLEALDRRIIEVPEETEHFEMRDSRAMFIAYAPLGSVKRGAALVAGLLPDKTPACATCHGPDLRGMGAIPPIAGRSPSYVIRQLHELQSGERDGPNAVQMKPVVEKLTLDDMISIAAYLASREP